MFQVLDEKNLCSGIYKNGEFYYENNYPELDKTWSYAPVLRGKTMEYASIYCKGVSLDHVCPDEISFAWKGNNQKIRANISACIQAKISIKDNCLFDIVPERTLKEYCELKNKICEHVFKNYEKPAEYNFYRELTELVSDISYREINIDSQRLMEKLYLPQAKTLFEKVKNNQTSIKYNIFNSVTGRLTVTENSFPILNLNSKLRDVIAPKNHWFVSFDLNAAEMRMAIALAGGVQPDGDLHEVTLKQVFNNEITRTQAKNITMQWMYDSQSELVKKYDKQLSEYYNRSKLFSDYWQNGYVVTPYGRKIESDRHHVISYLNQSSLIDMWHRQLIKVFNKLQNKKSFISFLVHDQAVIDLDDSEKNLLPEIISILSNTPYGKFPVKVEIGNNFMNMKKVNIKV